MTGETVHQEETERMETKENKGRVEVLEYKALVVGRVHLAPLPRVGWSTHAGGGPRVRVDREQSWSTVEELEGVTMATKEELLTTSACQTTHSTPAMHLECRTEIMCMVLNINYMMQDYLYLAVCMTTMSHVLSAVFRSGDVC